MLTLKKVKVEVATYGQPALREAGEAVLARLEKLGAQQGDATEVTSAQVDEIGRTANTRDELWVVDELRKLGVAEGWRRPARLSSGDTPVFERTRRISDMIAATLDEASHHPR